MARVTIELVVLTASLKSKVDEVIEVMNTIQHAFCFELIYNEALINELANETVLDTSTLYPKLEQLRERIGGHHPQLLGITDKQVSSGTYTNVFGDLQNTNGLPLGNGVITSFQVPDLIQEIPIEAYLIYQLIITPLLIILRKDIFHQDKRICPFDMKRVKETIYEVLKYSTLCYECSREIKKFLDVDQLASMRQVLSVIDDLSNGKVTLELLRNQPVNAKPIVTLNDNFEAVNKAIKRDQVGIAIQNLLDHAEKRSHSLFQDIILLHSQYVRLERQIRLNEISQADSRLQLNQIKRAALNFNHSIHTQE